MHSTPSAAKRSWMFATSRSRSWRRTNRLFSASSPNRTSRTTSLRPPLPITTLVINTALAFALRGRASPDGTGRPPLCGRLHLREPRARRGPTVRADPPLDRGHPERRGGPDLPDVHDCHRRVFRHQPPPEGSRGLPPRRHARGGRPARRGPRDALHAAVPRGRPGVQVLFHDRPPDLRRVHALGLGEERAGRGRGRRLEDDVSAKDERGGRHRGLGLSLREHGDWWRPIECPAHGVRPRPTDAEGDRHVIPPHHPDRGRGLRDLCRESRVPPGGVRMARGLRPHPPLLPGRVRRGVHRVALGSASAPDSTGRPDFHPRALPRGREAPPRFALIREAAAGRRRDDRSAYHRAVDRPQRRLTHSCEREKTTRSTTTPRSRMTNMTAITCAMFGASLALSTKNPRPTVAKMTSAPTRDRQANDHPTFAEEIRCGSVAGTVTRRMSSIPSHPMLRAALR